MLHRESPLVTPVVEAGSWDRLLRPLHRWVWRDPYRRARKLLTFAETEDDGGRDLARAAERTVDPLLRRLYLRHALDERRHADLFRQRARSIINTLGSARPAGLEINWLTPGERGLDDLRIENEREDTLLAFLHLSEKAAATRFEAYRQVLQVDKETQHVFETILRDETFHMNYTYAQLRRVTQERHGWPLWRARLSRLWRSYLRVAMAIAGIMGGLVLLVQYFLILPIFALLAKRAARNEPQGWRNPSPRDPQLALKSQY